MTKILVLDNYDSFVYTLNGYLHQLGAETDVIRNDAVTAAELPALMA
jgi:para-aminobenzoate synthetase component 2